MSGECFHHVSEMLSGRPSVFKSSACCFLDDPELNSPGTLHFECSCHSFAVSVTAPDLHGPGFLEAVSPFVFILLSFLLAFVKLE